MSGNSASVHWFLPDLKHKVNILISPLGWGLGHAARIIPLARRLALMGHNVIIAADSSLRPFFESELPGTKFSVLPGFSPFYSAFLPQYLVLLLQVPALAWHSAREHFAVRKIIRLNCIDLLISDNRFGLWNTKVTSVYITHMLRIPFPRYFRFLEFSGIFLHSTIIRQYDFCLVPDLPGETNLSGRLSHGIKLQSNIRYVGIMSRMSAPEAGPAAVPQNSDKDYSGPVLLILSGPEPQRTLFRKKIESLMKINDTKLVILGGDPAGSDKYNREADYYAHAGPERMQKLILGCRLVVCRSGYSTLMDLVTVGRSAVLVATPGQTEQEYLAAYVASKGWFAMYGQGSISLNDTCYKPENHVPSVFADESDKLLSSALEEILKKVHEKRESCEPGKKARPHLPGAMGVEDNP